MKIPKYEDLINDPSIGQIDLSGIYYFNVGDVRKKYDHIKFDTDKMIEFLEKKYIRYEDIHLMTEFDQSIRTALKHNPKKTD